MKKQLLHIGAPALAGAVSWQLAPAVGPISPTPEELAVFFSTMAVIMATLLIAMSLLSGFPPRIGRRIRKALSTTTFAWFGIGEAAAILGMIPTWPFGLYRYFFAAAMAGAAAALFTVLFMGVTNLGAQRTQDEAYMAKLLDPG